MPSTAPIYPPGSHDDPNRYADRYPDGYTHGSADLCPIDQPDPDPHPSAYPRTNNIAHHQTHGYVRSELREEA